MTYQEHYFEFQEELWNKFEALVRSGAKFPELLEVTYPAGINPQGLIKTTEGHSSFLATKLVANPNYQLRPDIGPKDLIVEFNKVEFIDTKGKNHFLEPEVIDLYWVCCVLDGAEKGSKQY